MTTLHLKRQNSGLTKYQHLIRPRDAIFHRICMHQPPWDPQHHPDHPDHSRRRCLCGVTVAIHSTIDYFARMIPDVVVLLFADLPASLWLLDWSYWLPSCLSPVGLFFKIDNIPRFIHAFASLKVKLLLILYSSRGSAICPEYA